jgi:ribosomal protein S18 acetylase RimI-like enzyme
VLVAEEGRPVGYVYCGRTPMTEATFDLYWLVVSAGERGKGLGRALVAGFEDHLGGRGGRTVRVETSSLEDRAARAASTRARDTAAPASSPISTARARIS